MVRNTPPRGLALVFVGMVALCPAQDRFQSGEFKGFTKSPIEHIIVRVDQSITVRLVHGTVVFNDGALGEVLFEIRGPGNVERIRFAQSDDKGRFNIGRVPVGTYAFKATKNGFQSVVGTIVVSKKADRQKTIKIEMPIGT